MIEPLLEAERALSFGLLDQAERLYRTVADADPRNSIAVVGLARVALDRGDDIGALQLGRRALAIDPQNVAAQRLVTRLEEVIAERGDQVPRATPAVSGAAPVPPAVPPGSPAVPQASPAAPPASPAAPPKARKPRRGLIDRLRRRS